MMAHRKFLLLLTGFALTCTSCDSITARVRDSQVNAAMKSIQKSIAAGKFGEAGNVLDQTLGKAEISSDLKAKNRLLSDCGDAAIRAAQVTGNVQAYALGRHCFEGLADSATDNTVKVAANLDLVDCLLELKEAEPAREICMHAIEAGDERTKALFKARLGRCLLIEKKYDEADARLREGIDALKKLDEKQAAINGLRALALSYRAQKKWAQADHVYNEAIDICEKLDSTIDTPLPRAVRDEWSQMLQEMHSRTWGQNLIQKLETRAEAKLKHSGKER